MEVINFRTKYSITDWVYILYEGNVELGKITAVVFKGDGYAYDVEIGFGLRTHKMIVRREEGDICENLDIAINFAVETYRQRIWDDWGYEISADGTVKLKKATPLPDSIEARK